MDVDLDLGLGGFGASFDTLGGLLDHSDLMDESVWPQNGSLEASDLLHLAADGPQTDAAARRESFDGLTDFGIRGVPSVMTVDTLALDLPQVEQLQRGALPQQQPFSLPPQQQLLPVHAAQRAPRASPVAAAAGVPPPPAVPYPGSAFSALGGALGGSLVGRPRSLQHAQSAPERPALKKKAPFQAQPGGLKKRKSEGDVPGAHSLVPLRTLTVDPNAAPLPGADVAETPRTKQTSRFRGVSCCGKDRKWQARIRDANRVRYLGRYVSEVEAALVYDIAAREIKGCDAPTNFVKMDEATMEALKDGFMELGRVPDHMAHLVVRRAAPTPSNKRATPRRRASADAEPPSKNNKQVQRAAAGAGTDFPDSPVAKLVSRAQAPALAPAATKKGSTLAAAVGHSASMPSRVLQLDATFPAPSQHAKVAHVKQQQQQQQQQQQRMGVAF